MEWCFRLCLCLLFLASVGLRARLKSLSLCRPPKISRRSALMPPAGFGPVGRAAAEDCRCTEDRRPRYCSGISPSAQAVSGNRYFRYRQWISIGIAGPDSVSSVVDAVYRVLWELRVGVSPSQNGLKKQSRAPFSIRAGWLTEMQTR